MRHQLNPVAIQRLLTSPEGPVAKALLIRGLKVETQAKKNLSGGTTAGPKRVDTGRLRASIATQLRRGAAGGLVVRVGTNVEYALWVHEGTGIYGPTGRVIRPTTSRYLRFKPKGTTKYVYAQYVKGMKANRFLTAALPAVRLNTRAG